MRNRLYFISWAKKTKIALTIFLFFLFQPVLFAGQQPESKSELLFFFSNTCHVCSEVKANYMPKVEKKYKDIIDIVYRDISDTDVYKFLLKLKAEYNYQREIKVPIIFYGGRFLRGKEEIEKNLEDLIRSQMPQNKLKNIDTRDVDLLQIFKGFTPWMIMGAGLLDGINPCAFTVIVFFISFLSLQGYKRHELIAIGSCFISSVFLTYLLLGIGILKFLYNFEGMWVLRRVFNTGIGLLTIFFGFCALYDFLKYKKTKQAQGLLLQLPQSIKNRIHAVIGKSYRKTQGQDNAGQGFVGLMLATFLTGIVVSVLESICTGQVYLPTITYVLKSTPEKIKAVFYLVLYNLYFIVPLIAVFLFALLGVASARFSDFLKRHFLTIKILMAVLFFSLGIYIIRR